MQSTPSSHRNGDYRYRRNSLHQGRVTLRRLWQLQEENIRRRRGRWETPDDRGQENSLAPGRVSCSPCVSELAAQANLNRRWAWCRTGTGLRRRTPTLSTSSAPCRGRRCPAGAILAWRLKRSARGRARSASFHAHRACLNEAAFGRADTVVLVKPNASLRRTVCPSARRHRRSPPACASTRRGSPSWACPLRSDGWRMLAPTVSGAC
jgi:hypothetical protein